MCGIQQEKSEREGNVIIIQIHTITKYLGDESEQKLNNEHHTN
jgi:hypothetical protein